MSRRPFTIGLVGPLPPPPGGMANQTLQLALLLRSENIAVEIVQANAPYRPSWVRRLRGIRALVRLIPYLFGLWRAAGRVHLFHVMANSGWAWHLFAAPAVCIAKLRGVPIVVNYRGGGAEEFFARSFRYMKLTLNWVNAVAVPSAFLQHVFAKYGVVSRIVPNIIDIERFHPLPRTLSVEAPHLVVTRNLEAIYDIETALRAFAKVRARFPAARMSIAGSGPELNRLNALARTMKLGDAVTFAGQLDNATIADLYRDADVMLNPSLVDNMPISILEALACGVPVVSTNVGGIPYLVQHEVNALLVAPRLPDAMAAEVISLLESPSKANALISAGLQLVQRHTWHNVRAQLMPVYGELSVMAHRHCVADTL